MLELVNGSACNNCSDVAATKKTNDPADRHGGPSREATDVSAADDADAPSRDPAVNFGGNLQSLNRSQETAGDDTSDNDAPDQDSDSQSPGGRVDVTA